MGQPGQNGYWVPVVKTEYETNTSHGLTLSDQTPPMPPMPAVDRGGMACGCPSCTSRGCTSRGCDSRGCDSRGCDSRGCDGRCAPASCAPCRENGLADRVFASLEYMSWYQKGTFVPPLVTASAPGTPQAVAGVLPGAQTLFGGSELDDLRQNGGRLTAGFWLDDCHDRALGMKLYGAEGGSIRFARGDNGGILARPFFNASPIVNAEDSLLVGFPGLTVGGVDMRVTNDFFGSEVFSRKLIDQGRNYRLDLYGCWQFNQIDSELAMSSTSVQGPVAFTFNDLFDVENEFNAGTLGLYGELYRDWWTFSALTKFGIGNMHQQVAISGNNSVIGGGVVTTNGGLFTQPTNIGVFSRDVICFNPEVNLKASCAISQRLSMTVGYTFMYWTNVAFAGDQVDRAVNGTQLLGGPRVGPARPAFNFNDSDFWVQTVDVGLSYNY
jgi:hypothetical protein